MMSVDWRRLRANLGPAHLVGGIRVEHIAGDWRSITVALQPRGLRRAGAKRTAAPLFMR